jgi:hypothetical protein
VPTVLRKGPYRFFFYSGDGSEPPHIHVERDDRVAKFWLAPVRLADAGRFGRLEAARLRAIVQINTDALLRSWHEFFAD